MKLDQLSANFPGKLLVLVLLAVEGNLVSLMYLNLGLRVDEVLDIGHLKLSNAQITTKLQ